MITIADDFLYSPFFQYFSTNRYTAIELTGTTNNVLSYECVSLGGINRVSFAGLSPSLNGITISIAILLMLTVVSTCIVIRTFTSHNEML